MKLAGALLALHCYGFDKWEEKTKAIFVYVIFDSKKIQKLKKQRIVFCIRLLITPVTIHCENRFVHNL